MLVLMRWMNLEPIIQTEVSQKEKNTYINAYIWNLERWHQLTYLQGSNGDADTGDRLQTQSQKERAGPMERAAQKHMHYHV